MKSYIIGTVAEPNPRPALADTAGIRAAEFLRAAAECPVRKFPSIGYGTDCRYRSASQPSTTAPQPFAIWQTPHPHRRLLRRMHRHVVAKVVEQYFGYPTVSAQTTTFCRHFVERRYLMKSTARSIVRMDPANSLSAPWFGNSSFCINWCIHIVDA